MIVPPLNDRRCLGTVTEFARGLIIERREELLAIASQFATTDELAWWIRRKPQVDDYGIPGEGPKVNACRPPQRLRVLWKAPNCFERTLDYMVLAELIDPGPKRAMVTINTRNGRHTFPVENDQAVVLDPAMTRNELEGALFQLDRRTLYVARNEALDWIAAVAEEPAAARGDAHRVRNARSAMRAVMGGEEITPQSVADIAYTVDEADRESGRFGARGRELHRRAAEGLTNALITQRRRNAGADLKLDNLIQLSATLLQRQLSQASKALSGASSSSGGSSGQSQLGKLGVGNQLLVELEKLIGKDGIKQGMTIGGVAIGGPVGGAIGSLAGDALISMAFRNAAAHRNASFWALKTPGIILDEINTTDNAIRALGKDIWDTFRESFVTQQRLAEARFEQERGRKPYISAEGNPKADLAEVYAWMQPVPTQADIEARSYQGAFVDQWGELTREWGEFVASHTHWYDRIWRGAYDKAIEFRERSLQWRERFQQLGGKPTAPAPVVPPDRGEPSGPWKSILLVAGLGAAALILPEVLRTFRGRRAGA